MTRLRLAAVLTLLAVPAAPAHPLPNLRFDRTVAVHTGPDALEVRYTLELNDWTMVLDARDLLTPAEFGLFGNAADFGRRYAAKKAPILADNLVATLDGVPLVFAAGPVAVETEQDHLRLRFTFRAAWTPAPNVPHRFAFEDQNFENRPGAISLTLDPTPSGLTVADVLSPADLAGKSPLDLKPGEERRLRRLAATLRVASTPLALVPLPPLTTPERNIPRDLAERGLVALFDSGYGLVPLLALAFLFGMAHAFTPGHGKTLVAAYLVGERGTIRHAVILGVTTTAAHTGSVILLAVVIRLSYGDAVPPAAEAALKLGGGLLIAGVGVWLFAQRVRGRADHVHLRVGDPSASPVLPIVRTMLLGLAGGLVPCWDAVLLLLVAISAGRLGTAVPLLISFSVGLAAVLVALGVGVVLAHRAGGRRFADAPWFRTLPILSATLLVGIGLGFARAGVQSLTSPAAGDAAGVRP